MLLTAPPALLTLLAVFALLVHQRHVSRLRTTAFSSRVSARQTHIDQRLAQLFGPITNSLSYMARRMSLATRDTTEIAALNADLMPLMEGLPQVSAVLLANEQGREYLLSRTPTGWLTRQTDPQRHGGDSEWSRWQTPDQPVETWTEALGHDPRRRPWYRGAVDHASPGAIYWTPPYRFLDGQRTGMTAAFHLPNPTRKHGVVVAAFDVLLTEINALTSALDLGNDGVAFVLSANGDVIGAPRGTTDTRQSTPLTTLVRPDQYPSAPLQAAYSAWIDDTPPSGTPFRFSVRARPWWANVTLIPLGNQELQLWMALPEKDLADRPELSPVAIPSAIITGAILLLTGWFMALRWGTGRAAGRPAGPISVSGVEAADDLPALVTELIRQGEGEQIEFKSSIRWNYKAGRTGKEMELAWLKTVAAFINSGGGAILLGVDDDGKVLGLDHDGLPTADKALRHVENLIAQHIDATHFAGIRSRICELDGQRVLLIVCDPSPAPAFLKESKAEHFYIRTGPASRALSPSEVLTYTRERGNP